MFRGQSARKLWVSHIGANQNTKAEGAGAVACLDFERDGMAKRSRLEEASFGANTVVAEMRLVVDFEHR